MKRPADIQLHIERLVLDGINLSWREREQLQISIETELGRLLGKGGLHAGMEQGLAVPKLIAAPVQTNATPDQLGRQIAASVYGGIGHEPVKS